MMLSQSNQSCVTLANQCGSILTNQGPGAGTAGYITWKRGAHARQLQFHRPRAERAVAEPITEPSCWRGACPATPSTLGPQDNPTAVRCAQLRWSATERFHGGAVHKATLLAPNQVSFTAPQIGGRRQRLPVGITGQMWPEAFERSTATGRSSPFPVPGSY